MAPEMWSSFGSVAFGIGSLVMGIILSSAKPREKSNGIIRYSLVSLSLVMILMTIAYIIYKKDVIGINALLITIIVIFLTIGVLLVLINVPSSTLLMKTIDKDKMGKVSSILSIGSQGLIPISMFLGGIAIEFMGPSGLLIICSLGLFLVAMILFFNKPAREL